MSHSNRPAGPAGKGIRTRHRLEMAGLRILFQVFAHLPGGIALGVADRIGDLLFDVVRVRREVTLTNIRAAFPEKSEVEAIRIGRSCYRNFARLVAEFARLPQMSPAERMACVEIQGREHLDSVIGMGRGGILLSGHFGNWEWLGAHFPLIGQPVYFVVAEQHNPLVGAFMDEQRIRLGPGILSAERDLRGILEALRSRALVAILGDQDAGRDGIFVDFLGRSASTAVGPVRLARRFGAPILQGICVRTGAMRFRLDLFPPILVPRDGDEDEVIRTYTELWSRRLEDHIRRYPDHWFWMHRRWKTRPPDDRTDRARVVGMEERAK
jgi:Kdo2-lipid IVA lauroyltransferase/acyltransferase